MYLQNEHTIVVEPELQMEPGTEETYWDEISRSDTSPELFPHIEVEMGERSEPRRRIKRAVEIKKATWYEEVSAIRQVKLHRRLERFFNRMV